MSHTFVKCERHFKTIKGEAVYSPGEKEIADFLYSQNVAYEYEPRVFADGRMWTPDFYLPKYDVYIEFLGMINHPESREDYDIKRSAYAREHLKVIYLSMPQLNRLGANLRARFTTVTGMPFPQTKYFDWRIRRKY